MFGNLGELMKMKKQMSEIQKKIKKAQHEGVCTGDGVKVVMNGEFELVSVTVSDELASSGDRKKIEKSILIAVNDAAGKSKKFAEEQMKALTGGLNIPGLSDLM
jgi:DNA-binding YbaB/EbfC family protein